MKVFFSTIHPKEVFKIIEKFDSVGEETVSIERALKRVLAEDVLSPMNIPGFNRATMDGYAVNSKDTFGASEAVPAWLKIIGEVKMGEVPDFKVDRGEAVKISTGGMLPAGTDAVVMLEYTQHVDETTIEVLKPVAPLEHVIQFNEDFKERGQIFEKGYRLRPQDLGILATIGKSKVLVYKRPIVAVVSTGDEIIPIDETPRLGQIRDVNSYTLSAMIEDAGGLPLKMGIIKDEFKALKEICIKALNKADILLLSGGSSVGTRDYVLEVISSFENSETFFHGVSVSPGKPTILARIENKAIWGLPGQVTSAMIVFLLFVKRHIQWIGGQRFFPFSFKKAKAKMARNVASVQGREDYIRVKLIKVGEEILAEPIFGKSGLISPMIKADGLLRVDISKEGLYKGEEVEVILF
ncbi:MAG: molybdenum cofactor biosynthesis protein [Syntrophobacter sp. DG_60]|nr:MAG: molybdenum cofactor biosynthesis protein [Syntrophobacter sp. DG_60]